MLFPDLLKHIVALCAATDLPSIAASCKELKGASQDRRSKLAALTVPPFNVSNVHSTTAVDCEGVVVAIDAASALCQALCSGALPILTRLNLYNNQIGDLGTSSLSVHGEP